MRTYNIFGVPVGMQLFFLVVVKFRSMCYFCSDVIYFQESPQEFVGRYTSLHMYVCDHLQDCNQGIHPRICNISK